MRPTEMNALIAAITNHLYCTLSHKDFVFLNIFLSEMSKSMFSLEQWRGICQIERKKASHEDIDIFEELEIDE